MMRLKKMVGVKSGITTCQRRCQALAPSMVAASNNDCGTSFKPAKKINIGTPQPVHREIRIKPGFAQSALRNQPILGAPKSSSPALTSPKRGSSITYQSKAEATV